MQDIIEGNAISLRRLFTIALHASATPLIVELTLKFAVRHEPF